MIGLVLENMNANMSFFLLLLEIEAVHSVRNKNISLSFKDMEEETGPKSAKK